MGVISGLPLPGGRARRLEPTGRRLVDGGAPEECELIKRTSFRTRGEARRAVFRFIEGWYNLRRRHSSLGYESPASFEARERGAVA